MKRLLNKDIITVENLISAPAISYLYVILN